MDLCKIKLGQSNETGTCRKTGPVQVIAVTGAQGDAGKAGIAVNLALALARERRRTMLLDADHGLAGFDFFSRRHGNACLMDVMGGSRDLDEVIVDGPDRLMIAPLASSNSQLAGFGANECAGLIRAFSELKRQIDTLVIDTASGMSDGVARFCRASNEVLMVISAQEESFRESIEGVKFMHTGYGVSQYRVLVNRAQTASEGKAVFQKLIGMLDCEQDIAMSYTGFMPCDDYLRKAMEKHEAVVAAYPRSGTAMALRGLARRIMNWPYPDRPGGHIEFFVERLIQRENVEKEKLS